MVSYYDMKGRFGNIILSIYSTFRYCYLYNIDFKNIMFNENGFCEYPKHFKQYKDYFVNIKDYFVCSDLYKKEIKKCIMCNHCRDFKQKCDNVVFTKFKWFFDTDEIGCKLLYDLFYNKEMYNQTVKKIDIDLHNKVALHVRRGDKTKIQCKKFLQSREQVLKRIRKYNSSNVIVFSDDVVWCKENLDTKCIFFDKNIYGINDWETHIIMCLCDCVDPMYYSSYSDTAYMINKAIKNHRS